MPRRLLNRCRPDCIGEFRSAAQLRFEEGLILASQGRRTAAIYLWGYTTEMIVKAAYFSLNGLLESDVITWNGHLQPAITRGRGMGIAWPNAGAGHNVHAWADLLVAVRALSSATAYTASFGGQVRSHGQRFELLWRETLRYRTNRAYPYEVRQVHAATQWFLVNYDLL